jgi:hypothetical protein
MRHVATLAIAVLSLHAPYARAEPDIEDFLIAAFQDRAEAEAALERIEAAGWQDGYAAMFVDVLDLLWRQSFPRSQGWIGSRGLERFLEERTGQRFRGDLEAWRHWVWSLPNEPHSQYGPFKGALYAAINSEFADFFVPPVRASIRMDEIQWGGVSVNGIPPLDHPAVLGAADADYLRDSNLVFGIFINGVARAYPKHILAWHELVLDAVGGRELTIVYCTLCGTVIPFDSNVGGQVRKFGTSGLLYRSNKLMFDHETKSLWSSLTGTPGGRSAGRFRSGARRIAARDDDLGRVADAPPGYDRAVARYRLQARLRGGCGVPRLRTARFGSAGWRSTRTPC